jgi:eukaryotic-like serine/threonine-protein kinase
MPDLVTVPALLGMGMEKALSILSLVGLEAEVTEAADTNFGEGHVMKVDPPAGTEVEPGSTVALTVSTGLSNAQRRIEPNAPVMRHSSR